MKIIRPVEVTDAVLVSSSVPESEPVYSAGTTYALDYIVRGNTTDTAHKLFKSLVGSNLGNPLTDDTKWLSTGLLTNRWAMFDSNVGSQTSAADEFEVVLQAPSRVDSIALLNVDASTVTVTMTDAIDGVVFTQTMSLVSDSGIGDWFSYFHEAPERIADVFISSMPQYANAQVTITLSDPGGTARCGVLVIGQSKELGVSQAGASVGIVDYSRKVVDDFGNISIIPRAYSKRADFTVWVERGLTDQVQILLAGYRSTPLVWIGAETIGATIIFGFFRDFSLELSYPDYSVCSLSIEGVT